MIRFSQDVEAERLRSKPKPKDTWEIFRSRSVVESLHKARDLGWGDKKVQVRIESINEDTVEYVIEPFEEECSCPNILHFDDYFLRPDDTENVD